MDKFRLIAEVKERPYLWRRRKGKKSYVETSYLWINVANSLGFEVSACKSTWLQLRNFYSDEKKRVEKRKKKNKYSSSGYSKWKFFEALTFLDNNGEYNDDNEDNLSPSDCSKTSLNTNSNRNSGKDNKDSDEHSQKESRKRSLTEGNAKFRLIAEMKKRPFLWKRESGKRNFGKTRYLWMNIAKSMGVDVSVCKSTWRQLRSFYISEKKLAEKRKKLKLYTPSSRVHSKWKFFESMTFLDAMEESNDDCQKMILNTPSPCINNLCGLQNNAELQSEQSVCVKEEPEVQTSSQQYESLIMNATIIKTDPDDRTSSKQYEPMSNMGGICIKGEPEIRNSGSANTDSDNSQQFSTGDATLSVITSNANIYTESMKRFELTKELCQAQRENVLEIPSSSLNIKKPKDQFHSSNNSINEDDSFSEYTVLDKKHSNDALCADDSDHSFLVTCLTRMKMMTRLQNLEFRAKMTDLMLNILSNNENSSRTESPHLTFKNA